MRGSACGRRARRSSAIAAGATCTSRSRPPPGAWIACASACGPNGATVHGPEEHDGGDRSLYVEDPEGNVVEVWDFFARRRPIEALSD